MNRKNYVELIQFKNGLCSNCGKKGVTEKKQLYYKTNNNLPEVFYHSRCKYCKKESSEIEQ